MSGAQQSRGRVRGKLAGAAIFVLGAVLLAAGAPNAALGRADAAAASFRFELDHVPMRDGVKLEVNLWIPNLPAGKKAPVILTLSPYNILTFPTGSATATALPDYQATWNVPRGYARAIADVRGTRNSEGCYDYGGPNEKHDGYDLVQWLGSQPWANGKVGMVGVSYDGTTINAAASEHPPDLAAIVPTAGINKWYDYAYQQGARYFANSDVPTDEGIDTPAGFTFGFGLLPPADPTNAPNDISRVMPCDRANQTQHGYNPEPDFDQYWQDRNYVPGNATSRIPTWVVHGLLDNNVRTWEGTQTYEAAQGVRKMSLGVWPHADGTGVPGWERQMKEWWDRYLMGVDSGIEKEPAVQVQFRDGTWHNDTAWPPATTAPVPFYLHPSSTGAGVLDHVKPSADASEPFYDDPTLTENRMLASPENPDPARLTYKTATLAAPLRVAGTPFVDIFATSLLPGTHYAVLLCDIDPAGTWNIAMRGFGNARYRNGLQAGVDLPLGQPYEFKQLVRDDDFTFPAGHRVGLVLSSSNAVWALPDEYRNQNTILHSGTEATALVLPVVGAGPASATQGPPVAASPTPAPAPSVSPGPLPNTGARWHTMQWPLVGAFLALLVAGLVSAARIRRV